jgi:DNA-binding transcriptional LysR family regulator
MHKMDWDDLRYFVALSREGSLSAAARKLGTEHTTVSRRIASLETGLGVRLFDRASRGFQLTPEGAEIAELAYRIEDEALGIERLADARDIGVGGIVRISAPPAISSYYLASRLASLRRKHPAMQFELIADSRFANLSRREADIAVRLSRPEASSMIARRVGAVAHGLYGAKTYVAETPAEQRVYIGYDESLEHVAQQQWILSLSGDRPLGFRSNELACQHQAAAAGAGLAALPRFIGDADPRLECTAFDTSRAATREVWLLFHADLRKSPRVRVIVDHLVAVFQADRPLLDPEYLDP